MGRRSKLTPFVKKKIMECVELGMPINRAANAVGISSRTFERWKARGENPNGDDDIFVSFVEDLEKSEANYIKRNLERIDRGAEKDASHAEWGLERRFPSEFGKRMELEVGPSKVLLALQDRFASLKQGDFAQGALGEPQKQIEAKSRIDDDVIEGDRASK